MPTLPRPTRLPRPPRRTAESAGSLSQTLRAPGEAVRQHAQRAIKWSSGKWQVSWREDDDDEDHDDGRPSAAEAAEMGVCCYRGTEYACGLCMCQCTPGPMMLVVTSAMVRATPTIGLFLSDTAAYIASKMWDDLLASQVFRIVPLPYCGSQYDSRGCTELAPAYVQFAYSFGLLAVTTVLRCLTEKHSHHGLAAVPSMLGMCVGWAFGRAFLAVLAETEADTPWCEEEHHLNQCSTVLTQRGAYAATITVLSALLIVGCQHLAATCRRRVFQGVYLERSGARQRLSVVRVFEALVATVERAAMTTCSILWNHALSSYTLKGLQPHSEAAARMLLFYSFTMTSGGALLAVASVAQRKRLRARPQLLRVCGGRSLAPALCQMLVILEGTLGWVAGCAWTDFTLAKWANLDSFPTLWVLGQDVLCALVLSALAAAWLTLTNQGMSVGAEVAECRSARERYFFTCALSFFCGWSWVAVARDALALPTPYLRNDLQLDRTVGAPAGLELA